MLLLLLQEAKEGLAVQIRESATAVDVASKSLELARRNAARGITAGTRASMNQASDADLTPI